MKPAHPHLAGSSGCLSNSCPTQMSFAGISLLNMPYSKTAVGSHVSLLLYCGHIRPREAAKLSQVCLEVLVWHLGSFVAFA
jgi:hypothetical protein